jgi:hypothetical protein
MRLIVPVALEALRVNSTLTKGQYQPNFARLKSLS